MYSVRTSVWHSQCIYYTVHLEQYKFATLKSIQARDPQTLPVHIGHTAISTTQSHQVCMYRIV